MRRCQIQLDAQANRECGVAFAPAVFNLGPHPIRMDVLHRDSRSSKLCIGVSLDWPSPAVEASLTDGSRRQICVTTVRDGSVKLWRGI
jgi:hypothetical protein